MKIQLLITTHYLFFNNVRNTVDFFSMVKHVVMGRARPGRGEDVIIGLVTLLICGHEMFALHRIARFREYSVVWVTQSILAAPKGMVFSRLQGQKKGLDLGHLVSRQIGQGLSLALSWVCIFWNNPLFHHYR